jgi:hypothetical protein
MPDDLRMQTCRDLMDTIQNYCNESVLPRPEIIGALECVKHSLIRGWLNAANEDED